MANKAGQSLTCKIMGRPTANSFQKDQALSDSWPLWILAGPEMEAYIFISIQCHSFLTPAGFSGATISLLLPLSLSKQTK